VPLTKGQELAAKMGVSLTLLSGAKHINEKSGYTTFPFLLNKLETHLEPRA
jgi:predicted alpha/beta hydrolase family esterase